MKNSKSIASIVEDWTMKSEIALRRNIKKKSALQLRRTLKKASLQLPIRKELNRRNTATLEAQIDTPLEGITDTDHTPEMINPTELITPVVVI